jgi:sulfur carrier protein
MNNEESIQIKANGKLCSLKKGQLIPDFFKCKNIDLGTVIIERNGVALTPGEILNTKLEQDDKLEIVRIVAGG